MGNGESYLMFVMRLVGMDVWLRDIGTAMELEVDQNMSFTYAS